MHNGIDPKGEIDHINRDTLDDRIENLRDVTKGANGRNKRNNAGSYIRFIKDRKMRRDRNRLSFSLILWLDEDCEGIRESLSVAVAPIIEKVYREREYRSHPPSPELAKLTLEGLEDLLKGLL
jgi:hypothetical protein